MKTPKSLTDLQHEEFTMELSHGQSPEIAAEQWFKAVGMLTDSLKVNQLFREDGKVVYEAFTDPGSVDYLYLIAYAN